MSDVGSSTVPAAGGIIRTGFGLKQEIAGQVETDYCSGLIEYLRESAYRLSVGQTTVLLAREFGFCYGVERAVDYAYETLHHFPGRRLFITAEIIHNPRVNNRLREAGVRFLSGQYADGTELEHIEPQDVVLLPAFGASTQLIERLRTVGCTIVDTTCGSVMNVWKRVSSYAKQGFTSIIHGKYNHEETIATASRAGEKYVVVLDKAQAELLCAAIRGTVPRPVWDAAFSKACPTGFDPDVDLQHVGLANQTTMLSSESLEIAGMVRDAIQARWGATELPHRFRSFDTICSATQERQDAMLALVQEKPGVCVVVGGFNSSNTDHLLEIALRSGPAYHIDEARCMESAALIHHKPLGARQATEAHDWLPDGPLTIGVTAGASTPNRVTGEVIARLLELRGETLPENLTP